MDTQEELGQFEYVASDNVTFIPEPEQESVFCPIISADDHAIEPPDLFTSRCPIGMQDQVPRVKQIGDQGIPYWVIDGDLMPCTLSNAACGRVMSEWGADVVPRSYDEIRRGSWDPVARTRDMDLTGVWASLCFPSIVFGFAGSRLSNIADASVGLTCLRAYNDWMIDEWCGASRERFIPCQLPWLRDVDDAAWEVRQNAARGFRAVSFSENPERLGFPSIYDPIWDPFFRACEETGTVINLHVGSSGTVRRPSSTSPDAAVAALFPLSAIEALIDWIYSTVPLRFPDLKIVLSEGGVSWVPMALERLTRAYRQASVRRKEWPCGPITPEELISRNFLFTSIEDPAAFVLTELIGEGNIMVETDYPHVDSTWPESQATIRREMQDLPGDVVRKICYENASRIYRHPLPPRDLVRSSEVGLSTEGR